MSWLLQGLQGIARFLGNESTPGTPEYREAHLRLVKERNEELLKPPQERDFGKLLKISKAEMNRRSTMYRMEKLGLFGETDDLVGSLKPRARQCCPDCLRVRQRLLASCKSRIVWLRAMEHLCDERLDVLRAGELLPEAPLPRFELLLPEGVPAELPPSIDRCAECQQKLEKAMYDEQRAAALDGRDPDWHLVATPQQPQPWLQTPPAWLQPPPPQQGRRQGRQQERRQERQQEQQEGPPSPPQQEPPSLPQQQHRA